MIENWICKNDLIYDKNLIDIFDFYVIKTPVQNVSFRGISFKDRGIKKSDIVLNKIKNISPTLYSNFYWLEKTNDDIEEMCRMNGIFDHLDSPNEYVVYRKNNNLGKTESFFYCIRCALAHGSFCIHEFNEEKYYFLENLFKEKGKKNMTLNARMVIKESTLLRIIDLCNDN